MDEIKYRIENINKSYGKKVIFKDFSIELYHNKVNCILGKSGCGKSTLLNIISNIIPNQTKLKNDLENINISYIFQEDRLIEWMTLEENINLIVKRIYKGLELEKKCDKYLKAVGIYEYRKYYPQMLSGGIRQRANIARAFIYPSRLIIMDEPFKSIDIANKKQIMTNFKEIIKEEERTVIFVTHDIEEVMYLSDNINILGGNPTKIKLFLKNNKDLKKDFIEQNI